MLTLIYYTISLMFILSLRADKGKHKSKKN